MTTPNISITDLTSNPLSGEGEGIFDVLIKKVSKELEQQQVDGYLKGSEYAQVYVSSLNATMQQSLQFLLSRDKLNIELQILELQRQAQKTTNEKLLIEKDILTLQKDIITLEKEAAELKNDLLELEKITAAKTHISMDKQNIMLDKQTLMVDKQILTEEQKRLNMAQELLQIVAQKELLVEQKESLVIEQNKLTSEIALINSNKAIADSQKLVVDETKNKTISETNLLNAKITTENFQTAGTPGGILGKQLELYEAQRDGFVKDALQKKAKIAADVWSVARTTDPDATSSPLTIVEIGNMIKAAG